MAGLPGIRAGNAAAIARHALIERMEGTAASGAYEPIDSPPPTPHGVGGGEYDEYVNRREGDVAGLTL